MVRIRLVALPPRPVPDPDDSSPSPLGGVIDALRRELAWSLRETMGYLAHVDAGRAVELDLEDETAEVTIARLREAGATVELG